MDRHVYHKLKRLCDSRHDGAAVDRFPVIAEEVAKKKGVDWKAWKYPGGQRFTFSKKWLQDSKRKHRTQTYENIGHTGEHTKLI